MSKAKSWNREIDFQCSFGWRPFQKTLTISAKGFEWCGVLIPLREITRMRWGTLQKRGGAFPKFQYIASFGTAEKEYVIKTKQKDFYEHLTERFWKAVGRRLLTEMLDGLANGETYSFGPLTVEDKGATIREKGVFSDNSRFYEWDKLRWGVVNGSLSLVDAESPDRQLAGLSFIWCDNTHILSAALMLLEQSSVDGNITRLSRVNRDF